jgi:hypothetical protein
VDEEVKLVVSGCDACPLDPCKLTAEECETFWRLVDVFGEISHSRRLSAVEGAAEEETEVNNSDKEAQG